MPERGQSWSVVFAVALGVVGVLMAHGPMVFSGLSRVQVDLGDSRLINYLLEHNYQWYRGDPLHRDFWDPPIFYPAKNVAAYSDTMLGVAPLYAAFRVAGFAPDTSFQLWTMSLSVLNYGVMLHFARRQLGLSWGAGSASAFLFAFGSPRTHMLIQQPQATQFLGLITIDCLFGLFGDRGGSKGRRLWLWLVATSGLLAQLSSAYYLGWFTVFSIGLAALVALMMPTTRGPFLATLARDAPWIALSAAVGGLAMRPWLAHHLAASRELGPRFLPWVTLIQPRAWSWLNQGPENWTAPVTRNLGLAGRGDAPLGVGLTTTLVGLAGLYAMRGRRSTGLLVAVAALLFLCVTRLPLDLIFVVKMALILIPVVLTYAGRAENPGGFLLTVGVVLVLIVLKVNPTVHLVGCALLTWLLAVAAFLGREDDDRSWPVLGALIVGLGYEIVPSPLTLGVGMVMGGIIAGFSYRLGGRSARWLEAVGLAGTFLPAVAIFYWDRSLLILYAIAAGLTIFGIATRPAPPSGRLLVWVAVVGLLAEVLYEERESIWFVLHLRVPGAKALLFTARVGLMMLVLWAVGVGYAIDALIAKRRTALAIGLGLVCLVEQGVTTSSYDKYANRKAIAGLARRVEPGYEAFYYSPYASRFPMFKANLDAMWAGLETGKPTLNGYSGHTPRGWRSLENSNAIDSFDLLMLEIELEKWREKDGRSVQGVQWIGGPEDLFWLEP